MELSIIIPAYNEADEIGQNLLKIDKEMSCYHKRYEIILVDDGSTDDTAGKAKSIRKSAVKVVSYKENKGKGYAIKEGVKESKGEFIVFLDADLEITADKIFELTEKIKEGYDAVIFSKNHSGSHTNFPLYRKILSKVYYLFAKALFQLPVSDTQTGCKIFRRELLEKALPHVYTKKFAFDLELLTYACSYGYRIAELPISINFKRSKGRIRFDSMWRMFLDTLIIFFRFYVKKIHLKG